MRWIVDCTLSFSICTMQKVKIIRASLIRNYDDSKGTFMFVDVHGIGNGKLVPCPLQVLQGVDERVAEAGSDEDQ